MMLIGVPPASLQPSITAPQLSSTAGGRRDPAQLYLARDMDHDRLRAG